jgi:hypothetical protein
MMCLIRFVKKYHPSILASLGGTPYIFLGSHAHKMFSLQEVLEYDIPKEFSAHRGPDDVAQIISLAINRIYDAL